MEQCQAEFFLEQPNLRRKRRLAEVQPLGRAGQIALADNGDKSFQAVKFHALSFEFIERSL